MKPSQLVSTLRRIASNIERSKNPDRNLVAKDLKKIVSAMGTGNIVVHEYADAEYVNVVLTNEINPQGPCSSLTLPNGDTIIVAKDLNALKAWFASGGHQVSERMIEALFQAGIIDDLRLTAF